MAARRSRRRSRRRARGRATPVVVTLLTGAIVAGGVVLTGAITPAAMPAVAGIADCDADASGVLAMYTDEQVENAAAIMDAGAATGFGFDGQRLGVMAAMGESGLRNIDYGDWETSGIRNPDGSRTTSIGLFQQQEWWGTVEERMDPTHAATMFFMRLASIEDWAEMDPSRAIHRVQINADADHYTRWDTASHALAHALWCST